MTTGLRAGELRSLTRKHLDANDNGLWLEAGWTKSRKATFQPLPKQLVERLACFCDSGIVPLLYQQYFRKFTCPDYALLYVPSHPARTLDKDLITAEIPKCTEEGKVAFHALRTSFVTLTFEAGANHKEAQQLARHSTPELTANIYNRTRNERLVEVADRVTDMVLLGKVGANMVQKTERNITVAKDKSLQKKTLTPQYAIRAMEAGGFEPPSSPFCKSLWINEIQHKPLFCNHLEFLRICHVLSEFIRIWLSNTPVLLPQKTIYSAPQ